jgi:hypothetical protein
MKLSCHEVVLSTSRINNQIQVDPGLVSPPVIIVCTGWEGLAHKGDYALEVRIIQCATTLVTAQTTSTFTVNCDLL